MEQFSFLGGENLMAHKPSQIRRLSGRVRRRDDSRGVENLPGVGWRALLWVAGVLVRKARR